MDVKAAIRRAMEYERQALEHVLAKIGDSAEEAVMLLYACQGRVIVTGMGKAGLIGRKIAATLSSTGTPAHFLHPTEAVHGDLGAVTQRDVVVAVSNSGETREVLGILPYLRGLGVRTIALTGNVRSSLAQQSDVVVDVGVEKEADPLGMAPTASTTATLAMGDALASALMLLKGFTRDQYAQVHPGGTLGATLLSRVSDLMARDDAVPLVRTDASVREAVFVISSKRLGAVFVVEETGALAGILTDGDLRRLFERESNPLSLPVSQVMVRHPKTIGPGVRAVEALRLMEDHQITILPVVDETARTVGAIHMHDLVKAGLALWKPTDW